MDGGSNKLNGHITQLAIVSDALSDTVNKLHETALASGEVISHRLNLAMAAAANPAITDHEEYRLMASEKIEGFSASANATFGGLFDIQASMMQMLLGQASRMTQAVVEAATSMTPAGAADAHKRWVEDSLAVAQAHSWEVANKLVDLSAMALDPLHSRATDNARRLGRRGRAKTKPGGGV